MKRTVVLTAMVFSLAGCGIFRGANNAQPGGGGAPHIADNAYARIPASQLGAVQQVRQEVQRSNDGLLRAQQQEDLQSKRVDAAKQGVQVAKQEVDLANAHLDVAKGTGDRGRIDQAQHEVDVAKAKQDVAQAKLDVEQAQQKHAQDAVALEQAKKDRAQARLELAKFDALRASGDAAADQYDRTSFTRALTKADDAVNKAEQTASQTVAVRQAQIRLENATAQLNQVQNEQVPVRGTEKPNQNPNPNPSGTPRSDTNNSSQPQPQ